MMTPFSLWPLRKKGHQVFTFNGVAGPSIMIPHAHLEVKRTKLANPCRFLRPVGQFRSVLAWIQTPFWGSIIRDVKQPGEFAVAGDRT